LELELLSSMVSFLTGEALWSEGYEETKLGLKDVFGEGRSTEDGE